MILGAVDEDGGWEEATIAIGPGDTLLLYTDGVTDTPGETERFGDARLVATLTAAPEGAAALLASITPSSTRSRAAPRSTTARCSRSGEPRPDVVLEVGDELLVVAQQPSVLEQAAPRARLHRLHEAGVLLPDERVEVVELLDPARGRRPGANQ